MPTFLQKRLSKSPDLTISRQRQTLSKRDRVKVRERWGEREHECTREREHTMLVWRVHYFCRLVPFLIMKSAKLPTKQNLLGPHMAEPKAIHLILPIANQKISSVAIGLIWDMRHKTPRFIESERRTFDIDRNQLLNKSLTKTN